MFSSHLLQLIYLLLNHLELFFFVSPAFECASLHAVLFILIILYVIFIMISRSFVREHSLSLLWGRISNVVERVVVVFF